MSMWISSPRCSRSYRRSGWGGFEGAELVEPQAFEDAANRARRDAISAAIAWPVRRCHGKDSMRSVVEGMSVVATNGAASCGHADWAVSFDVAGDPFPHRARANACGFTGGFGVCPLRTILTRRSRPSGVRRAFIWMSILLPKVQLNSRQAQLPPAGSNGQPIESSQLDRDVVRQGRRRDLCSPSACVRPTLDTRRIQYPGLASDFLPVVQKDDRRNALDTESACQLSLVVRVYLGQPHPGLEKAGRRRS